MNRQHGHLRHPQRPIPRTGGGEPMRPTRLMASRNYSPHRRGGNNEEPVPGCTDPEAINFALGAERNDESCFYQSTVSFYITTDAHGLVDIYINDRFTGRLEGFWSGQPGSCGQPFTVTLEGFTNSQRIKWTAIASDGTITGAETSFRRGCSFVRVF